MALPQPDPSLPGGAAPVFGDTDAARGDHLRANNQAIWENLEYLNDGENINDADAATPVDADRIGFFQIAGAVIKYVTFANLWVWIKNKFVTLSAGSALGGTEKLPMVQSSSTVYTTPADLKTYLDTYFAALQTVLWVRDEKTSGTAAQSVSASTWNKRDLGTTKTNTIAGASVSSSVITLPAGTYEASAFAVMANVTTDSVAHQIRIYNTSDSSLIANGSSEWIGTGNTSVTPSIIQKATFTLSASKNIELQHWTGGNNPGGRAVSSGSAEVYADIFIKKVA